MSDAKRSETAIDATAAIDWLEEAASYFAGRDTHGEDSAHWANAYNAANCQKIAALLRAPAVLPDGTPVEDILTELREVKASLASSRHMLRGIRHFTANCKSSEAPAAIRQIREMIDNG